MKWGFAATLILALVMITACDGSAPAPATGPGPAAVPTATLPPIVQPGAQQPAAQPPAGQPPADTGSAAIVNGQPISMQAYQQQTAQFQAALVQQGLNPNSPEGQAQLAQMRQLLLDNMIDDVLIAQEAARQGVTVSDADLDVAIQQLIELAGGQAAFDQKLIAEGQSLAEARSQQRTMMTNNLMRDRVLAAVGNVGDQIHYRHILVDSQATAEALLAQIQAGADFGQVAQQSSQDSLTKENGGDSGWVPRGVLVSKEVEDAAFNLQPGQVSGVIQSSFGFHIVQVIERDPARQLDEQQVLKMQQQAVEQWLSGLRAAAKVERLAGQ